MKSLESLFLLCFAIVFYSFVGYGIILFVVVKIKSVFKRPAKFDDSYEPEVTMVVPCYNEACVLQQKIENTYGLDYPKHKLQIAFITDGSTDNSLEILAQYPGIKTFHISRRGGKTAAENRAIRFVKTPVVIFSDANTILNKEAVRKIVRHFANEKVGCVSGEKRILTSDADVASAAGEGFYWKYESLLKKLDYQLYSAVGAAGELVAFRTDLFVQMPEDTILDDFIQSMTIAAKGYKIAYEPEAYAVETASESVYEELKRKIRICAGGWQSIGRLNNKLSILSQPVLYFQYFSHRVLRWTVNPFLLIAMFFINMALMPHSHFYRILFAYHLLFYVAVSAGYLLEKKSLKIKAFFIPYYFFIMNYAVLMGLFRFIKGSQTAIWEKNNRMGNPIAA